MPKKQRFFIKGTIPDSDYDKLLVDLGKDKMGHSLKIGDKIAYGARKYLWESVQIGEVEDIWLEYGSNGFNTQPNLTQINCYIKVNPVVSSDRRKLTRSPTQVAKIV